MAVTAIDRPPLDQAPPPAKAPRIAGVDIARGLVLIGMFSVHVSIFSQNPNEDVPGWIIWWLTAPAGRSAVMFMLLAGVSLSIIQKRHKLSATDSAIRKRGLALLVGGLLLTTVVWPWSILEHYGMLFLIAPWLLALRTRHLAGVAAVSLIAGPLLLIYTPTWQHKTIIASGALSWLLNTVYSLWIGGFYPLVVWLGIFAVGIIVGRLDLRSKKTGIRLAVIGFAAVVAVSVTVAAFAAAGIEAERDEYAEYGFREAALATPTDATSDESPQATTVEIDTASVSSCLAGEGHAVSPSNCIYGLVVEAGGTGADIATETHSLKQLLDTTPHSGTTVWAVKSMGFSLMILGLLLLAPALITRLLRPLAMLGSISLSAYLIHIALITDIFEPHVEGSALSPQMQFVVLIGLQGLLVAMAVVIRRFWVRGPFEWLIKKATGVAPAKVPS